MPLSKTLPWHLADELQSDGEVVCGVNLGPAWEHTQGRADIRVAVHDQGLWTDHPCIEGRCDAGAWFGETLTAPHSFRGGISPYHGTACAALIVGRDIITGVAPECRLVPVGIASQHCAQTLTASLCWAAQNADVVLTPWSTPEWIADTSTVMEAFTTGRNGKGTVWIAPGRNANHPGLQYPARLNPTIAVGSVTSEGRITQHSRAVVDRGVLAPGCGGQHPLLSIANWERTGSGQFADQICFHTQPFPGTSGSAALVAGAAALLLSILPNLTARQVRQWLCYRHKGDSRVPDSPDPVSEHVCYEVLNLGEIIEAAVTENS